MFGLRSRTAGVEVASSGGGSRVRLSEKESMAAPQPSHKDVYIERTRVVGE
jgi:hypothetical protein